MGLERSECPLAAAVGEGHVERVAGEPEDVVRLKSDDLLPSRRSSSATRTVNRS